MLTAALIKTLEYSSRPESIAMTVRALEVVTGVKTSELVWRTDDVEWYQRNGFNRLAGAAGGHSSHAGKSVGGFDALDNGAVLACVKIFSEDIAGLPFFLHERSADGETLQKAYGETLYKILHDAPNPEMSAGEFREALTARALLGMDGYAKIERARTTGKVSMLWPLTDATVTQRWNRNGQLYFEVKEGNSEAKDYRREEIFHLKGFTLNGHRGDDILQRARHAIGLGLAADEYAGKFFAADASPGLIISRPATPGVTPLTPDGVRLLKEAWIKWHRGASRSHEPAVLQDGMTVTRNDPDHQKLQIIESRKHQVTEVARIYRMPLHKLAELDRSTNNNIEHQGIEYVSHGLGPWRRRWEDAVHRCLLTQEERYHSNGRPRLYAEFNVEAMLRGDFAAQTEGWTKLLEKGVFSINDVRKWLGLNPIEGGDAHHVQLNMRDVSTTAAEVIEMPLAAA